MRIVSVRRGGSVSGVWAASSSTAPANRSSSSSELKNPTLIRTASSEGDRPGDREDPGTELIERRLRRPAGDAERDQGGHPVARRDELDAVDRGQAVRPPRGQRRAPVVDPVEPDEHRSASRSSGPCRRSRAGGSSTHSKRRASGHGTGRPGRVDRLEAEVAAERRRRADRAPRGRPPARPCPPGPAAISGRGSRRDRRRVAAQVERDRAGALRPVDDSHRATSVGDLGDRGRPASRAPVVQSTCDSDDQPRVRSSIAASKAASDLGVVAIRADIDERRSRSRAVAQVRRAVRCRPGCSRVVVTTRSPGRQSNARLPVFMPSVVEWSSAISPTSVTDHGRDSGARLGHALERLVEVVDVRPTASRISYGESRPWPPPSRPAAARRIRC